ncbi:hypothetical protein H9P43_004453 [Blastocladiella emersonii ATCC 22665]|nr:hypothetical protein H9P43_004453 [Blastocladiella emersonii ATCC 22665]
MRVSTVLAACVALFAVSATAAPASVDSAAAGTKVEKPGKADIKPQSYYDVWFAYKREATAQDAVGEPKASAEWTYADA